MTQLNDEIKIRECLEKFVEGWSGKYDLLDECIVKEPYVEMSMFGHLYSVDLLKSFLPIKKGNTLDIQLINYSAVVQGNEARQYATVIGLFKNEKTHLAFGGTLVTKVIKENEQWLLNMIRFDLQCEDSVGKTSLSKEGMLYRAPGFGDKTIIANWKVIDDRIGHNMSALPNMGKRMISPEYDTPWYVIKEQENIENDETQIKNLLYKYCYGFDLATFPLVRDILCDDIQLKVEEETFTNKRDVIGYLKLLRKVKPRSFHSVIFDNLEIDDNTATVKAYRISPDLRTTLKVSNDLTQWIDGYYVYTAVKKENQWYIQDLNYTKNEE